MCAIFVCFSASVRAGTWILICPSLVDNALICCRCAVCGEWWQFMQLGRQTSQMDQVVP